jgi:hypothetical protein
VETRKRMIQRKTSVGILRRKNSKVLMEKDAFVLVVLRKLWCVKQLPKIKKISLPLLQFT